MSDPEYTFVSPQRQLFSLPLDVITFMLDKPSSHKGLLELYQTCKYFYSKRPILITDNVRITVDDNQSQVSTSKIKIARKNVTHLQTPIWLTDEIYLYGNSNHHQRLPKFFRYSVKKIILFNSALQYEDFVLLTSEKEVHYYRGNYVYHSDMSKATIDDILPHLPNIKEFSYSIDERCSAKSLKKLNEIKFKNKFVFFYLDIEDVHPTFDLDLFCQFIVKNTKDDTELMLRFFPKAKEKLNASLFKLDSKWHTEDCYVYIKLILNKDIYSELKEMEK